MVKKIVLVLLAVSAITVTTVVVVSNLNQSTSSGDSQTGSGTNAFSLRVPFQPTPSPEPFSELTIPYLQNRTYQSSLGELQQTSENANYTSYLTSYTSDELKINGLLTEPKGEMPSGGWPAIVFVHGYIPPSQYRTQEKYEDYVDYLARNGFVVFKIDLRGHGNSEGSPSGTYYSTDYIIDTLNARAALQNWDSVNADHVGLWGHSMAGNIVMRSMVAKQDIPAGVIWAGAVYTYQDIQDLGIDDNTYRPPSDNQPRQEYRERLTKTHGQFDPNNAFWKKVPATNYLDDFTGAIEIHHAVNDDVVSIEYSRNLANLLENAGIQHELYEYNTGGHNISGSAFSQAMQRTVSFYKNTLQ